MRPASIAATIVRSELGAFERLAIGEKAWERFESPADGELLLVLTDAGDRIAAMVVKGKVELGRDPAPDARVAKVYRQAGKLA